MGRGRGIEEWMRREDWMSWVGDEWFGRWCWCSSVDGRIGGDGQGKERERELFRSGVGSWVGIGREVSVHTYLQRVITSKRLAFTYNLSLWTYQYWSF